jgi:endonuclease/exonuclease/phosphatase family metal-dependent hydrolase
MKIKIATFNLENLFNRYAFLDTPWEERDYEKFIQAVGLVSIASREGDLVSYETTEIQRNNTAMAILDVEPDILAVQEVENIYTLRIFNDTYLDNYFDKIILIDGNDPRGIDVGFMIKKGFLCEILNIRTHVDDGVTRRSTVKNFGYKVEGGIFSRDCLEVDVKINGKVLTFLVNHLKAQDSNVERSAARRKQQADEVFKIAEKASDSSKLPVVLGDLNVDYRKKKDDSLDSLIGSDLLVDPFPEGTWTHYYTSGKETSRLDYILLHKDLKVLSTDVFRKGLTTKCKQYKGDRYPTIGPEHTEASDHCPTSAVIEV